MGMGRSNWPGAMLLFVLLSSSGADAFGRPALPPQIQAVLLAKIVPYNRTFAATSTAAVRVLVVHSREQAGDAASLAAILRDLGFAAVTVDTIPPASTPAPPAIVYVMADTFPADLQARCEKERLLTVSNDLDLVERGFVTLGLGVSAAGRPEMVVNLPRAEREGQAFSGQFLHLARVVR